MLWSKSIRHDGKLFSICQCTEYIRRIQSKTDVAACNNVRRWRGTYSWIVGPWKTPTEILLKSLYFLDNSIYISFKECSGCCKLRVLQNGIIFFTGLEDNWPKLSSTAPLGSCTSICLKLDCSSTLAGRQTKRFILKHFSRYIVAKSLYNIFPGLLGQFISVTYPRTLSQTTWPKKHKD